MAVPSARNSGLESTCGRREGGREGGGGRERGRRREGGEGEREGGKEREREGEREGGEGGREARGLTSRMVYGGTVPRHLHYMYRTCSIIRPPFLHRSSAKKKGGGGGGGV